MDETNNRFYGARGLQAVSAWWHNGLNFTGRSSRAEYWWAWLGTELIELALLAAASLVLAWFNAGSSLPMIAIGFTLLRTVPDLALHMRRYRDAAFWPSLAFVGTLLRLFALPAPLGWWVSVLVFVWAVVDVILCVQPSAPPQKEG